MNSGTNKLHFDKILVEYCAREAYWLRVVAGSWAWLRSSWRCWTKLTAVAMAMMRRMKAKNDRWRAGWGAVEGGSAGAILSARRLWIAKAWGGYLGVVVDFILHN